MTEATSTGLSENAAGAIAYITFVPAIVFLVLPPYNASPNIRFHAWQSIFFTVAVIAIGIALAIFFGIAAAILPFGFYTLHWIGPLIDLGWLALWLVCVLKALNGGRFTIPVIGALAAQQAGK